jgi:DNA-binding GntR family transcriptional regulator
LLTIRVSLNQEARMTKLVNLPVEKRLLDRQAADLIRTNILTGLLSPGRRLPEAQLALELAVSRGTVRAALAQLAHERLVRQVAFTKWEVSGTSLQDAWEVYTLRSMLEGLAARLAARRGSADARARLKEAGRLLTGAIREARFQDITEADFRVHQEIVAMTGHARLVDQHRLVLQQVRFHMVHAGFMPRNYRELAQQHEALISAVVEGHADLAESLARGHNVTEIAALEDLLSAEIGSEAEAGAGARP